MRGRNYTILSIRSCCQEGIFSIEASSEQSSLARALMNIARSLKSLLYSLLHKESRSVPRARETQCAISLTYQTIQAQHNTEWRDCHSHSSGLWQAPYRRQL